ncbi:MAG TPA: SH3 domain-containing protein [Croceibacterium sp.]|nr:SH3 domain-containing protein [Croceibacterium sp.]
MQDMGEIESERDTLKGGVTFALSGPEPKAEPGRTPLRGDLAHIGLAGKFFVPHYAVPQPRAVMPGGAPLMSAPGEGAEELCTLIEGDSFEVLDIVGTWAWGCLSLEGPVGYVKLDRLEALA